MCHYLTTLNTTHLNHVGHVQGVFGRIPLTSDEGCDLVLASSDTILDLTDKRGVDSIVHLQYLQIITGDLHCVWHLACHTARTTNVPKSNNVVQPI